MLVASIVVALNLAAGAPVKVVGPTDIKGAMEAQAAVDEHGYIYVVYGSGNNIYCSTSDDKGKSFDPPTKVATGEKLALGMRRGPRISVGQDTVLVSAVINGNLKLWTSSTRGKRFSDAPAQINDMPDTAIEGLHAQASKGEQVVCAWLDNREGGQNIYAAISEDGGDNWGPNTLVYKSPSGSVCECCHPSVAIGSDGAIHVMFRNSLGGNRDMYLSSSTDDGQSWSEAAMLGQGHWKIDKCPMDGGAIGADDQAQPFTIWRRNGTIYRSRPGYPETKIGTGEQPWLYAKQGVYCVYLKTRPGPLMMFRGANPPRAISHDANDPVVAGPEEGSGPVVAVWTTSKGEIMCDVLND